MHADGPEQVLPMAYGDGEAYAVLRVTHVEPALLPEERKGWRVLSGASHGNFNSGSEPISFIVCTLTATTWPTRRTMAFSSSGGLGSEMISPSASRSTRYWSITQASALRLPSRY